MENEFLVEKYTVNSVYTMTKYKVGGSLNHGDMLLNGLHGTYEEYVEMKRVDIHSLGKNAQPDSTKNQNKLTYMNSFKPIDVEGS